ncbi:MAG TPA: hypothetical protein VGM88_08650 [Kofleriaceae bacterium]
MHLPRRALVVALLAGCSGSVDVAATWSFHTLAGGADSGCPDGFDVAIVNGQRIDADLGESGEPDTNTYDCAGEEGSAEHDPGLYLFTVTIANHDGQTYATSAPALVNTGAGDRTAPASFVTDGGFVAFSWDLVDGQTDQTVTCTDAGMEDTGGISVATGTATDLLRCADHFGVTDPLPVGTYTLTLTAEASAPVGPPTTVTAVVTAPNGVADLGHLSIPVDGVEGDPH